MGASLRSVRHQTHAIPKMTFDYSSETPPRQFVHPPSLSAGPAPQRSGETLQFSRETFQSVAMWTRFPSTVQSSMSFAFIISTVR